MALALAVTGAVAGAFVGLTDAHAAGTRTAGVRADLNGDGRADLVEGAPGENAGAGSVRVPRAASGGVTATGSFTFGSGAPGTVASGAQLGCPPA